MSIFDEAVKVIDAHGRRMSNKEDGMRFKDTPELPSALRALLTRDLHVQTGKYSVTGLIAPPRVQQLRKRHADEIVVDPYDRLWSTWGTLMHSQLEAVAGKNVLAEELLTIDIDGVTISGSADVFEDGIMYDYKTTSAYAVKDGLKPEWEKQLNMYAYMYKQMGFACKGLKIVAILKDWSKTKAQQDAGYPQTAIKVIDIPIWHDADVLAYMQERVALHEAAESMSDDELPECTADEMWARPTKWAVMKKGRKSAVKLHDSELAAQVMIDGLDDKHYIEHRPGEAVRCNGYCEGAPFCSQFKKSK